MNFTCMNVRYAENNWKMRINQSLVNAKRLMCLCDLCFIFLSIRNIDITYSEKSL